MLKADVIATILVKSEWVRDLDEGRSLVAGEFHRHRPNQNMSSWNTHVPQAWADAYIARVVAIRPTQIQFGNVFKELDDAA